MDLSSFSHATHLMDSFPAFFKLEQRKSLLFLPAAQCVCQVEILLFARWRNAPANTRSAGDCCLASLHVAAVPEKEFKKSESRQAGKSPARPLREP